MPDRYRISEFLDAKLVLCFSRLLYILVLDDDVDTLLIKIKDLWL